MFQILLKVSGWFFFIAIAILNYNLANDWNFAGIEAAQLTIIYIIIGVGLSCFKVFFEKKGSKEDLIKAVIIQGFIGSSMYIVMFIEWKIIVSLAGNGFFASLIGLITLGTGVVGIPIFFAKALKYPALNIEKIFELRREKYKKEFQENLNNKISAITKDVELNCNCISRFENDFRYSYNEKFELVESSCNKIWVKNDEKADLLDKYIAQLKTLKLKVEEFNVSIDEEKKNLLGRRYISFINKCNLKKKEIQELINRRIFLYEMERTNAINGELGEKIVNQVLEQYDNIYNLANIRIEELDNEGKVQSVESDNIVIARQGIFIIEVKNLGLTGSYSIKVERDGRWTKLYNNGKAEVMKSATEQNNRHIVYINKAINKVLRRDIENYIDADGIVVLANDKVSIINESVHQKIVRVSEVYLYIKEQPVILSKDEMDRIRDYFIENNLEAKKFPINDYINEVERNIKVFENKIIKIEKALQDLNEVSEEVKSNYINI